MRAVLPIFNAECMVGDGRENHSLQWQIAGQNTILNYTGSLNIQLAQLSILTFEYLPLPIRYWSPYNRIKLSHISLDCFHQSHLLSIGEFVTKTSTAAPWLPSPIYHRCRGCFTPKKLCHLCFYCKVCFIALTLNSLCFQLRALN